jgi:ribonuclease HII
MIIIGVDEAGVGSIAGPMIVAAAAYPAEVVQPELTYFRGGRWRHKAFCDSKTVAHELLPAYRAAILESCLASSVATMTVAQVEKLGTDSARDVGMYQAVRRVLERLKLQQDAAAEYAVIVDGDVPCTVLQAQGIVCHTIAHADRDWWQVSAASLLAKEAQNLHMRKLHRKRPCYGWNINHGYPTKEHVQALKEHGVSPWHRRTYRTVRQFL